MCLDLLALPSLLNLAHGPVLAPDTKLNSSQAPVLAMIVATGRDAGASLCLLVVEDSEDTEDDGDAGVELDAHQAVGDGVRDVLEVHGLALDEDTDGDYGVKGTVGAGAGERGEVGGGGGEQVARRRATGFG